MAEELSGLQLREAVAREVMGYARREKDDGGVGYDLWAWTEPSGKSWRYGLPEFDLDIAAAWSVVEKLKSLDLLPKFVIALRDLMGFVEPVAARSLLHDLFWEPNVPTLFCRAALAARAKA